LLLLLALPVSGCGVKDFFLGGNKTSAGQPGYVAGFLGGVAADEPQAALVARQILSSGGSAADAAVALAFALTVTLPSRAGLGSGGACIAYNPDRDAIGKGLPEAIEFLPQAPLIVPPGADRPAAVPMLARGMYALYTRYGRLPFESLTVPAEQMARFGTPVSRALATDLAVVAGPLLADPDARAVFGPGGTVLAEGGRLVQPDLGATLTQIRTAGVGDLYQGALARRLVDASAAAGGPLTLDALRAALPKLYPPLALPAGNDMVAFLPPPADGGLAAAAAFRALQANRQDVAAAQARAIAVAARWRQTGGDPMAALAAAAPAASLPPLPASTSFVTLDKNGLAVACALTMDNLFGTGRVAPGTGVLLAAAPSSVSPPLLAAAIAWNNNIHAFRAAVGGSGQDAAAEGVAVGMINALAGDSPMPVAVPDPGRINAIGCPRYLPGDSGTCRWATDPRGAGLAVGSN
jgi:gamma-glutamyltranspeptidase/glutathione hydrolase